MKKKTLLSIITLLALLFIPARADYVLEQGPDSYPDLPPSHWAYEAVTFLTDKQVVVGYPDGLYRPDQKVTRGEFATMAIKALGLYEKETPEIFNKLVFFQDFFDNSLSNTSATFIFA